MMEHLTVDTERLRLTALTAEALTAWVRRDAETLRRETGVEFRDPLRAPPLFEEDLPAFDQRMREAVEDLGWWAWLVSTRADNEAVGVCALGGRPEDGTVAIGYSVYPEAEGRGYATEASAGLIGWALTHDGVGVVRATVPTWNLSSAAVARKLGMEEVERDVDDEVGEVAVFELCRPSARP
jgi:RimJ/RimL family protein N-acetyltransferase